jgi:ankyrin repeat protein
VCELLVKNGSDVNHEDQLSQSALFYACREDHLEIVKFLLEKNADPLKLDQKGQTPINFCKKSSREVYDYIKDKVTENNEEPFEKILLQASKRKREANINYNNKSENKVTNKKIFSQLKRYKIMKLDEKNPSKRRELGFFSSNFIILYRLS